jgi:hypothetical protein
MPTRFRSTPRHPHRGRALVRAAVLSFAFAAFLGARANAAQHIDVRAASIGYFPGDWLLVASGHASVSDGTRTVSADELRYDLFRDKVLATGNVHVAGGPRSFDCAAYAFDRRTGEARFILLDGETPEAFVITKAKPDAFPERPPAGTFEASDVTSYRPYIEGPHAIVIPQTSVRFTPAKFPTGLGTTSTELPAFLYTFASNPNLYQTSLQTVTFDQPFGLAGDESSLTQLRLRYSTNYGAGAGIEQHFIDGNKAYIAVAAIAGHASSLDLLGYTQIGKRTTFNLSASSAQGYDQGQARLTYSMPNLNTVLLATQYGGFSAQTLTASTPDKTIPHLIAYRFTAAYGHANAPGTIPFSSTWQTTVGGSLYTLPGLHGPFKTDLSARLDYGFTGFDFDHDTLSSVVTLTAARELRRHVQFFGSAQFAQFDSRYAYDAPLYLGLPSPSSPLIAPDGTRDYGYFAYDGLSTMRTYYASVAYTPNSLFNLTGSLTHADDFPAQFHGYGRPPLQATLDLRVRVSANVQISYYRSYNFGWAGQYFAPGAQFVLTP